MKRRIRKVLLMVPPRIILAGRERKRADYPVGLGYVAAMLRLEGFEVLGLDVLLDGFHTDEPLAAGWMRFGLGDAEVKARIAAAAPDVVGVSNLFSDGSSLAGHMCRLAKEVDPDIVTLMGGAHPTSVPEDVLTRHPSVDYVVLGEGEYTTGMLLRALSRGDDLARLPGIAYREDGGFRVNPFIEPIQTLDLLPFPDRTVFPVYKYSELSAPHGDEVMYQPYTNIITSRGCPARCIYCAVYKVHGRRFRALSAEKVLDEIEILVRDMGFREFHIHDDNLTHSKPRAMAIFRGIQERGLDIAWTPTSGVVLYNMDREMLTAMRDSGCYAIWVAVESGHPRTLRRLHKPMPIKRIAGLVQMMRELGMKSKGFFMYGFPGETAEEMETTFQFARQLGLDYATFFLATPLPATPMWDMAVAENPILTRPDFEWENLKYAKPNLMTAGFSLEEMERIRRKVWLKVNWNLDEDEPPPPGM